jgi:hypothetical protein
MGKLYPKTLHGWRTLFWLAIHRCPDHHCRLHIDGTIYDVGGPGYCFKCEGIGIWPRSMSDALEQNFRAAAKATAQIDARTQQ